MVLPTSDKISSLNNFSASQSVFVNLSNQKSQGDISLNYQDADIRGEIYKVNKSSYDVPKSNTKGVRVAIDSPVVPASVELVSSIFDGFKSIPVQHADYVFLTLDMMSIGQKDMAQKIADLAGSSFQKIQALDVFIQNKKELSTTDYQSKIESMLSSLGVNSFQVFKTHPYYFEQGLLRAQDAFSIVNFDKTGKIFAEYLRLQGLPKLGNKWYEKAKNAGLGNHPSIVKEISKLDPATNMEGFLRITSKIKVSNEVHELFFSKLTDPNVKDNDGSTPLHFAAEINSADAIKALVATGADPKLIDRIGLTPIHSAADNNSRDAIEALVAAGVDPNLKDIAGLTPLHSAADNNSRDAIEALVAAGADLNLKDKDGLTPIHMAVDSNSIGAIEDLIAAGANINLKDSDGLYPLHSAAYKDSVDAIEPLLAAGTDPNLKDSYGVTPLHLAAASGSINVIKALVTAGADPNLKDSDGETPLHLAANSKRINVIHTLVAVGADPNLKDKNGLTSLHSAVVSKSIGNSIDAIKALLTVGADPTLIDIGSIDDPNIKNELNQAQTIYQEETSTKNISGVREPCEIIRDAL